MAHSVGNSPGRGSRELQWFRISGPTPRALRKQRVKTRPNMGGYNNLTAFWQKWAKTDPHSTSPGCNGVRPQAGKWAYLPAGSRKRFLLVFLGRGRKGPKTMWGLPKTLGVTKKNHYGFEKKNPRPGGGGGGGNPAEGDRFLPPVDGGKHPPIKREQKSGNFSSPRPPKGIKKKPGGTKGHGSGAYRFCFLPRERAGHARHVGSRGGGGVGGAGDRDAGQVSKKNMGATKRVSAEKLQLLEPQKAKVNGGGCRGGPPPGGDPTEIVRGGPGLSTHNLGTW